MHGKLHVVAAVHGATRALWEGFVELHRPDLNAPFSVPLIYTHN